MFSDEKRLLIACADKRFGLFDEPRPGCSGVLEIGTLHLQKLLETGVLRSQDIEDDQLYMGGLTPGINLVIRDDNLQYLWDCPGPESIDTLLQGIYLVSFAGEEEVALLSHQNIFDLLMQYGHEVGADLNSTKPPLADVKASTVEFLASQRDFSGRCYVCDFRVNGDACFDPGCWSEFCWKKDGRIMIYLSSSMEQIIYVDLFPNLAPSDPVDTSSALL